MKTSRRIAIIVTVGVLALGATYLSRLRVMPSATSKPRTQMAATGGLEIVRQPPASGALRRRGPLAELPVFDPKSTRGWQVDLRGRDLTQAAVANRLADLRQADFDSRTRWPRQLPAGFEPGRILDLNKNPGLGVRQVHARGIRGRDIGIGIVDQTLLVGHVEYRGRLRSYEEMHLYGPDAQMHGPAVASAAVGRSVGVAPEADLYYIATTHGTYSERHEFAWDFTPLARAIDRLLEINHSLPSHRKIRVISVSVGWSPTRKGYPEAMAAVERATRANVFVLSCAVQRTHQLSFHGLGRSQTSDPDKAESYGPGAWWAESFWAGDRPEPRKTLLVPMDARTLASPTGDEDYTFYPNGGWSWSVPWLAGLYALACQVRPEMTPELFWSESLRTGRTISIARDGAAAEFGTIADPVSLIAALQK